MLTRFPQLSIFPASEVLMLRSLELGAAGCISATNNINARDIALAHASPAHAARLSSGIEAVRKTAEQFPMVAAVKHTLSLLTGDDDWRHLRPPLVPLDADTAAKVEARMRAALPALRRRAHDGPPGRR